nr:MAG TPA: Coronin-1A [Caudoviricetes sp.]
MLDEKDLQQVKAIADEARRGAVHDMQVIIENTIMPSLKLLAEGQQTILQTLTPKSETEELREELDFLKSVVRSQSQRIEALEKRLA